MIDVKRSDIFLFLTIGILFFKVSQFSSLYHF